MSSSNATDGRIQAIRERDRNRCQNCLRSSGEVSGLEVHQIVPGAVGGSTRLSNLVLLCAECHRRAHEHRRGDGPDGTDCVATD